MKKLFALLVTVALLLGLEACGGNGVDKPTTAPDTMPTRTTIAEPEITTQVVEAMIDPDFDATALFQRLKGYWNTWSENHNPSFVSFIYHEGKPSLCYGPWESETAGIAALAGGQSTGEGKAVLTFLFPAITEAGEMPTRPEMIETVQIDFSGIDDGKLKIQLENPYRIGEREAYTFGGKTMEEAGSKAFMAREAPTTLRWNEALLAELGMTYKELTEKYGLRMGQGGDVIRFENAPGSYSFNWAEQPAPTARCNYIVVPAKTLFLGLSGSVAKEVFLTTLGIRDGDGYGPVLRDGYEYHTVMHFGDPLDSYQLSIWHNEKNAFQGDDLAAVLDPSIN